MTLRQTLSFTGLAGALSWILLNVHLIANDALVSLLPGDGCGQVTDQALRDLLSLGLSFAYGTGVLFALAFSATVVFARSPSVLCLVAVPTVAAFLTGGLLNLRHADHLTACDMFLFGRDAPALNLAAAGACLGLTLLVLLRKRRRPSRP